MSAFADSREHLWAELERIDQLVRAQTLSWRALIGNFKPAALWGMVHVTDAEVDAYLASPFGPPKEVAAPFLEGAAILRAEIDARLADTPSTTPLRLDTLCRSFTLSGVERDLLLACLLPELDPRYRRLYGYLQDDVSQSSPTVELVLAIAGADRALVRRPAPLVASGLVVIADERQDPRALAARGVRVDERVVAHLLGADAADPRLARVLRDVPLPEGGPEPLPELVELVRAAPSLVLLEGPYGSGRLAAAAAACAATRHPLLTVATDAALDAEEPFGTTVDLCIREARLRGAVLCWERCELLLETDGPDPRWHRLVDALTAAGRPAFLISTRGWDPAGRHRGARIARMRFAAPDYEQRGRLWEGALPLTAGDRNALAGALANDFRLTGGQILDALAAARTEAVARDPLAPQVTAEDVREGCRRQSGRRLVTFARRIEPRHGLRVDDLVLPPTSRRQLEELRDRIRHRGRVHDGLGFDRRSALRAGLVALFTGGSGTGKTTAAALLAQEQGVDLYKIDLSAVVSKYVGETEKNLSHVFADAEDANAILFFDEADALFGKRGEVHDARDRWANIEVNHLLQRIEEFTGPVILASNLNQNIDDAFLRRIHVIVDFPFPDAAGRLAIWRSVFPTGLPRPPDDELATVADRFPLAGGSIRNVALDATFSAVAAGNGDPPAVALRHVVAATAREYEKLSKPVTAGEFGEDFYAWITPPAQAPDGG